tara:strand:- start:12361 stop:12984 length:624 start_codon:yes stop_codon:yes gene_type:complete
LISPNLKQFPTFKDKLRIGILASGAGTNFKNLILLSYKKKLDIDIVHLIINNNQCGAIDIAKKYKIPYTILANSQFASRESQEKEIITIFKRNKVELVVMAGWMRIATNVLISEFEGRLINIHPSLLPSFKGKDAIKQAMEAGVKITGCTTHFVSKEVDSGSIIAQASVKIEEKDSINVIREKIHKEEYKILPISICIVGKILRNKT